MQNIYPRVSYLHIVQHESPGTLPMQNYIYIHDACEGTGQKAMNLTSGFCRNRKWTAYDFMPKLRRRTHFSWLSSK